MKNFFKKIKKNWYLKLLAFILALSVWVYLYLGKGSGF